MTEVDLNGVSCPLSWIELFGRSAPTDVEIGAGKGRFLLELALANPGRNFLGVERAFKYHAMLCRRAARRGVTNVRLVRTTAEDLLFRLLAPASVENLYVLFPDPWPKKRHHKRRLVTPAVVDAAWRALAPGGRLLIKTDHPEYAEVIGDVLAHAQGWAPHDATAVFEGLPLTGFEVKYVQEGRPIRAFVLEKLEDGPGDP
ncbi:MAG: tRNA (guanosine(46)-N7)-methyltransferase TrmB [Acidobacteria bacterium]|nr:tRNA (guanosine(46)-N7)-methyltransferase TrmB [Acidobacteriota bacterium]